ncbi:MAG: carbohydrate ABC transporter permease [Desulfitobacteriaceae bacterium]
MRWRKALIGYAFISVPLLFFLVVRIGPTLYTLGLSFKTNQGIGLANYQALGQDPVFWAALRNTLLYVLLTVPLQIALGLLIALGIQSVNRFREFYRVIYFIPYITSTVAVSWVWRWLYFKDNGLINRVLNAFGIHNQPFLTNPSQALVSVAVAIIWQNIGFTMLIFLAGLEAVPKTFYEAAAIDGANHRQTFWRVTLPLLNPTLIFLTVTGVINSLQTFTQILNMTGNDTGAGGPLNSTVSLVVHVYNMAFMNFNMPYGSAVTVILFLIILAVTLIQMKVLTRNVDY